MTQTLIEKIQGLQRFDISNDPSVNGKWVYWEDILSVIEEYKATEQAPVAWLAYQGTFQMIADTKDKLPSSIQLTAIPLFTHPQLSDETVKDAAIGKLVREKMQSGNDVPVSRCTITRIEFDEAMEADNAQSKTTKA